MGGWWPGPQGRCGRRCQALALGSVWEGESLDLLVDLMVRKKEHPECLRDLT